jgi:hypothetical protein
MLIDIHAKSSLSQGVKVSVEDVLTRAKEAGIDAVAFTEQLSSSRCKEAIEAGKAKGIKVFIGVEIPTDKGLLLGFVPDIDTFYTGEEWSALTEWTTPTAADIIELFTSKGGALIAARPYDLDIPFNMGDMLFTLENIHGVEVYNSRLGDIQIDFALEAASFLGLPTTGGSDPKGAGEKIGDYATFFINDIETQADFVNALRNKEFWAIQLGKVETQKTTRESDPFGKRRDRRGGGDRNGGNRGGGNRGGGNRGGNRRNNRGGGGNNRRRNSKRD